MSKSSFFNSTGWADNYKKVPMSGQKSWSLSNGNIESLTSWNPKAIVKVISYAHNVKSVRGILDYIAREGALPLFTTNGMEYFGKDEIGEIMEEWRQDFAPSEISRKKRNGDNFKSRLTMHMIVSLPPEYSADKMKALAEEFAKSEFDAKYDYVYAIHDDKDHPHAHFVVNTYGFDGQKLKVDREDLAHWRAVVSEIGRKKLDLLLDHSPVYFQGKAPYNRNLGYLKRHKDRRASERDKNIARAAHEDAEKGVIGEDRYSQFVQSNYVLAREEIANYLIAKAKPGSSEQEKRLLNDLHQHYKAMPDRVDTERMKVGKYMKAINDKRQQQTRGKDSLERGM